MMYVCVCVYTDYTVVYRLFLVHLGPIYIPEECLVMECIGLDLTEVEYQSEHSVLVSLCMSCVEKFPR